MRRVVLLVTSPRLPAGLLTAPAWDLVRAAPVLAEHDTELTAALRAQGVAVTLVAATAAAVLAQLEGHAHRRHACRPTLGRSRSSERGRVVRCLPRAEDGAGAVEYGG